MNKDTHTVRQHAGLTQQQVEQSRRAHGSNTLTPPKRTPLWRLYLEKYSDPIVSILLLAAAVSLALAFVNGDFIETIGIFIAIFFATTVGFVFARDAARKFDILTALGEESPVRVVRDGQATEVARHDIVVGDSIIIDTGDEIPADARLVEATGLQCDESSLTGEPVALKHVVDAAHPSDADATYPSDMVLRSAMVMAGHAVAVVTAVGDGTEIGKVARKSAETTAVRTPLSIQLTKLAKLISKVGTAVSVAAFVIFLVHDILTNPLWRTADYMGMAEVVLKYFMMAVTLIVMAVPEGLPMAVTLALALNMRRMLKSNNLVRKMHACETMGATTLICTDKTGTLTQNRMQVDDMHVTACADMLGTAIAMNTTADIGPDGTPIGNPTDSALLLWLDAQGRDYRELRSTARIVKRMPFSTEKKYMATLVRTGGEEWLFVKGAPEYVVNFCDISDAERTQVGVLLRSYQARAMRTLALACRKTGSLTTEHMTLQAIVAISDPIRPDVPDAVESCRQAGIDVKIVTGDTAATACEIARQIGVATGDGSDGSQITGPQFEQLSDEEALARASSIKVMSRARPTDKQRLVNLLQKRGEVVAVTGDGTNDAPALNHAHVGLSLGSGTSVAKNASDITLIDDSFRSIVRAVMWGRSLYKNIQRFLFFQLVVNVAALLLVLGGSVIGTELPLTVTQILWINLIMDTFAAMALASLPPTMDVMRDKPRAATDFIIPRAMGRAILATGILLFAVMFVFLVYCERGNGVDVHELTLFFTVFVMMQWWNLLNAKALGTGQSAFHGLRSDRTLLMVMGVVLAGQWIIVTFGGKMFRTVPLSLTEWVAVIVATSPVLWVGEAIRKLKNK